MDHNSLLTCLSERQKTTLEELEGYFDSPELLIQAIKDDKEMDDAVHEIADGRVSIWTSERMQWLTDNLGRADQENAIGCGAKTVEEIAAYCWYEAEREDILEDIEEIRAEIEKITE